MTPIYLNSSPSPFPTHDLMNLHEEEDQTHHLFLSSNFQPYSSSNSFSSTQDHQTAGFHQQEADDFGVRSYNQIENENGVKGLKFSIWKKEVLTNDDHQILDHDHHEVKWMSSKMRVMLKMKKPNPMLDINLSPNASPEAVKVEDQKLSLSPDQNYSSNSSSSNSPLIRVCSDCNTTKTPLWRSGPQGPKTLCNACGIRQRKARRAMAAAAAESGTIIPTQQALPIKAKLQIKEKKSPISSGHITKYKKKCKPSPPSSPGRKNCFENFLITLSKNLAFQRVFPQDEKEAAILLMALSCGYVQG